MRTAKQTGQCLRPLANITRRFRRDEAASLSVEAALIAPLLFWAFIATYTYFDVYRVKNLALKGNYAISDLLSRETNIITSDYLTGAKNLYRYLTRTDSSSWLRVTVVHCIDGCAVAGVTEATPRTLSVDWSRATNELPTFSDTDINEEFDTIVPLIAEGERVIIVETTMDYEPLFSTAITGIGEQTFNDVVVTRPRFAPQLCFEGVGCGVTS